MKKHLRWEWLICWISIVVGFFLSELAFGKKDVDFSVFIRTSIIAFWSVIIYHIVYVLPEVKEIEKKMCKCRSKKIKIK